MQLAPINELERFLLYLGEDFVRIISVHLEEKKKKKKTKFCKQNTYKCCFWPWLFHHHYG